MIMIDKALTQRDEAYLEFIRTHPCCICGGYHEDGKVDAHHLQRSGVAVKGPDYSTIPLCRIHHGEYHQIGQKRFEQRYLINLYVVVLALLAEYIGKIKAEN